MKKLIVAFTFAGALSVFADTVESSTTFGVLKVDVAAGTKNLVIAVPWEAAGATGETAGKVYVKDLVKTSNLTAGDQIFVFDGQNYSKAFILKEEDGVKSWVGQKMEGDITAAAGTDTDTISRGLAIGFSYATAPAAATSIYLYGQYTTDAASATIAAGSSSTPTYTLVAPTGTTTVTLDTTTLGSFTPNAADTVYIPGKGSYSYVSEKGFGSVSDVWNGGESKFISTFTAATVPAGTGYWYISRGGSGTISL